MNDVDFADRFKASWDSLEPFYDELLSHSGWEWVRPIKGLIRELRTRGYDQNLRAGQALYLFMLSRSQEHGLRLEQPRVIIEPRDDGQMVVEYRSQHDQETVTLNQMAFCPELQYILDRLLAQEIDGAMTNKLNDAINNTLENKVFFTGLAYDGQQSFCSQAATQHGVQPTAPAAPVERYG